MQVRSICLGAMAFLMVSCANPAASVQSDVDTFLKKYPSNFGSVESNHRKVHFAWSGDPSKPALIFVHGSPGSWRGWAHFLLNENLQGKFHIIAIDRLGYGDSGRGLAEPSLEKQAQAVLETLRLNVSSQRAILVGHSFGGPVIASAAMLDSKQIAGLVFVASSVSPELEKTKWFQYPATWWPFRLLIPTELRVCNEEIFPLKGELSKQTDRWKFIDSRVAVIQGVDDQLVPQGNADYLQTHLSSESIASFEKIQGLGHFIPWERPDLILKAIETLDSQLRRKQEPL